MDPDARSNNGDEGGAGDGGTSQGDEGGAGDGGTSQGERGCEGEDGHLRICVRISVPKYLQPLGCGFAEYGNSPDGEPYPHTRNEDEAHRLEHVKDSHAGHAVLNPPYPWEKKRGHLPDVNIT